MKIRIEEREVEVLDRLCPFRSCLWIGEWKGALVRGVGYRYAPRSQWHLLCFQRSEHGCPSPIPAPDPEKARCCHAPVVRPAKPDRRGHLPKRQRCLTCGVWLSGFALACVRAGTLAAQPAPHPCRHAVAVASPARPGWWECNSWDGGCRGAWDHKPAPGEHPQADFDELYPPRDPAGPTTGAPGR
jgi:hypothetical protein